MQVFKERKAAAPFRVFFACHVVMEQRHPPTSAWKMAMAILDGLLFVGDLPPGCNSLSLRVTSALVYHRREIAIHFLGTVHPRDEGYHHVAPYC